MPDVGLKCTGCGCSPPYCGAMPDVHDHAAAQAAAMPPEDGAPPLPEGGTIQNEQNNAAVAVGAHMARAVAAAEHYRQTGTLPAWATDQEDPPS